MLTIIFLIGIISFLLAYILYGGYLVKKFRIDDKNITPSHAMYDGIDYVPAKMPVLFGHHFSSIAGAGPILGPIIAGIAYGWLPVFLWITLGSIFAGAVHDFSALVASMRHKAKSIAELAEESISKRSYLLFLIFIWLAMVYVLTVFTDLTATTFKLDPGVATTSIIYIFLAIGFGLSIYRLKAPLSLSTIIFVGAIFTSIWIGQKLPIELPALFADSSKTWDIILIIYCFIASVTPVWILLQPRDYLCSYLLYASILGGFFGIIFGRLPVNYPAVVTFYDPSLGPIFPILFVTVACGAISGFHSIVASGTSSKQIDKETDAKGIGYGAMLIEGLVAIIALAALMIAQRGSELSKAPPLMVYGTGIGAFLNIFGIPKKLGFSFGLLALSTFILTTLDTATRLARYVFQELFSLDIRKTRFLATAITLILPTILVLITLTGPDGQSQPAWKIIWPVFGATNQLLAALALLVIALWLKKINYPNLFVLIPMIFMLIITLSSLGILIFQYKVSIIGIIAIILFILALFMLYEAKSSLTYKKIK